MKVKLHKAQYEIAIDPHRFRIVCAGRRFGKSILAELITLKWAVENPGKVYWIVSPTIVQSKQIHWRQLQKLVPSSLIEKKNEVERSITLTNGSVIELKGAENPDALRGVKLAGLIIDEIASIRNWTWLWSEVLRPTLTDYQAPALFISTPQGYNHFYDLYQQGLEDGDYKSWRFTSYDNPYISKEEIDNAKRELTDDTFHQEYMADFRTFVGLAHKQFDRNVNLIDSFEIPIEWSTGRGFDYGSTHPTASVRIRVDNDDNWFVDRCYKQPGQTIKDHAEAILSQDYATPPQVIYGDPSGAQWETEFAIHNLYIQPATRDHTGFKSWVEFGVEMINQRLKPVVGHTVRLPDGQVIENAPRLFILNTQENQALVKEFELLKWKTTTEGGTTNLLDENVDPAGHFDLLAALRYFTVSFVSLKDEGGVNDFTNWQIGL